MNDEADDVVERLTGEGEIDQQQIISLRMAAKNVLCGSLAGSFSAVFKYPFDLTKVRLQAQLLAPPSAQVTRFKGPLDCLTRTYREEGFRGLYRGLPAPIVGSMTEAATLFFTFSAFQDTLKSIIAGYDRDPKDVVLSTPQVALAAGSAGFVTSFLVTPIDLIKCKMQVQLMNNHFQPRPEIAAQVVRQASAHITSSPSSGVVEKHPPSSLTAQRAPLRLASSLATASMASAITAPRVDNIAPTRPVSVLGPIQMIKSVIHTHGVRGLWVGHSGMMILETTGAAGWFTVKELVGRQLKQRRARREEEALWRGDILTTQSGGKTRKQQVDSMGLLPWESAVAGAAAGASCVLALYPIDTVKSAMQTEEDVKKGMSRTASQSPSKGSSFIRVLTQMYRAHGFRGLYSGCGMTVARVVPSSGIVFMVYDGLSNWLD